MPRTEVFDRKLVIEKAMDVFWKKGFHGTSVQDLVDATGLNRSSLYNSFGSKRALYQTTLEAYEQGSNKIFRKALLHADDPLRAIKNVLESVIPAVKVDKEGRGCYILSCKSEMGSQDEQLHGWLSNNQEQTISIFRELIEQGQLQGQINKRKDAESYAYLVFNTFQGLRMTGILTRDMEKMKSIIDDTIMTLK